MSPPYAPPPATPPGYVEFLKDIQRHDTAIDQAKRDLVHFRTLEEQTSNRFFRILSRLDELEEFKKEVLSTLKDILQAVKK